MTIVVLTTVAKAAIFSVAGVLVALGIRPLVVRALDYADKRPLDRS